MNKNNIIGILLVIIAIVAVIVGYANYNNSVSSNGTVKITDMLGRMVYVPAQINTTIATSPPITDLIYMLAPDKLGAWNSNLTADEAKYTPSKYQNLPVIGGWYSTYQGNPEDFIAQNPSVIIYDSGMMGNSTPSIDSMQQMMGSIPVVDIASSTDALNYTPSIEYTGKLLGATTNANNLVNFYNNVLDTVNATVSTIPQNQKVTVYYAEGDAGLQTDPNGSAHSQLINICGGINVAQVPLKQGNGMSNVNMEQVLQWNPDVIITDDQTFFNNVYSNSSWQDIKAVQDHRVYLTPTAPLGWFDRPPGVNTIIGIPWTAKVLYPDKFSYLNMTSLTEQFYSEFYHVNLTDGDVKTIMDNQNIT